MAATCHHRAAWAGLAVLSIISLAMTGAFAAPSVNRSSGVKADSQKADPVKPEPTFTPRPALTALTPLYTPVGEDGTPLPRGLRLQAAGPWVPVAPLFAPLGPLLFGTPGRSPPLATVTAEPPKASPPTISSSPPASPTPQASPTPPALPKPAASPKPAAAPTASPSSSVAAKSNSDFAEWEGSCLLPEDLPAPADIAPPGARLRVRVDAFLRVGPSCQARILDVVAAGTVATVMEGGDSGWYRLRLPDGGGVGWVGAKLLAPP